MITNRHFFLLISMVLMFCNACRKDIDIFVPYEQVEVSPADNLADLSELFKRLEKDIQTFSVLGKDTNKFVLKDGGQVYIPPYTFKKPDLTDIEDELDLEVLEAYSLGDFIRHNQHTFCDGQLIQTSGNIYVEVLYKEQLATINANGGDFFNIHIPVSEDNITEEGLQLFYGYEDELSGQFECYPTNTQVWLSENDKGKLGYTYNTQQHNRWMICGKPFQASEKTDVHINVPKQHNAENTVLYIAFPKLKGLSRLYEYDEVSRTFYSTLSEKLPVGLDAKIVAISLLKNGNVLASFTNTQIEANHSESISFEEISLEELNELLNSL